MTINFEQARHNMIDNQVRPWDVVSLNVLDALGRVHREDFVPQQYRNMAFADLTLPLGHDEVMMKPVVEGRVLQALELKADERVLEIGTGSGYLTACMAQLAAHVTSIEQHAAFTDAARKRLAAAGTDNVTLETAEAIHAYQPSGRFDAVVLTGAVADMPERPLSWLKPGGRAFVIEGESPVMHAKILRNQSSDTWHEQSLFETDLPYLAHAAPATDFAL